MFLDVFSSQFISVLCRYEVNKLFLVPLFWSLVRSYPVRIVHGHNKKCASTSSNGVCISVFFVALVANIPLVYSVGPFFNNEKQESEGARIQPLSPDISFLAAFPLAFCFSREPLPLRAQSLSSPMFPFLVLNPFNHEEMFFSSPVPQAESSL